MLFGRKNRDKHKSTRDLNQGPSETTQVLDTHKESSRHGEPKDKTLDEMGVPPPPRFSSQSGDDPEDFESEDDLVPYNAHLHETSEAELPPGYERGLVFGDGSSFGYGSAGEMRKRSGTGPQKTSKKAKKSSMPKVPDEVTPSQAKKYFEKIDSKVRKIDENTKASVQKLSSEVNDDLKDMKSTISDLRKENKRSHKTIDQYRQANEELLRQNKRLKKELESLHKSNEKILNAQEKNESFIEGVKKDLEPFRKREEELLKWFSEAKEEMRSANEKFDELLKYSKEINSRNEDFTGKIDKLWKHISGTDGKVDEFSREAATANARASQLSKELQEVMDRIRKHDERLSAMENAALSKKLKNAQDEISSLRKENKDILKELGRYEQKFEILREKIDIYKKNHKEGAKKAKSKKR
ncbi:MAG: hypothetical protein ACLFNK_04035 [Candidatus Woesearchaeota archaeon]